jgi:hypothetical protein
VLVGLPLVLIINQLQELQYLVHVHQVLILNKDIIEILNSIGLLSKNKLKVRLAWKLESVRRALTPAADSYNSKVNYLKDARAIKNEQGKIVPSKDENGNDIPNTMMFDKKVVGQLNGEINMILEDESEVEFNPISASEFGDMEVPQLIIKGLFKAMTE